MGEARRHAGRWGEGKGRETFIHSHLYHFHLRKQGERKEEGRKKDKYQFVEDASKGRRASETTKINTKDK